MNSTHTYTAVLAGPSGPVSLRVTGGRVSEDTDRIPHVEATITASVVDPSLYVLLDPRLNRRVMLTAERADGSGTTIRTWDLGVREYTPDRRAGTVQIRLASDEALLADWGLGLSAGPYALAGSLRAVTNWVLAHLGTTLEPGTLDADLTPYWDLTNLVLNPSMMISNFAWLPGTGAAPGVRVVAPAGFGGYALRWSVTAAGDSNQVPSGGNTPVPDARAFHSVTPGSWYVFAFQVLSSTARQVRASVQFWTQGGSYPVTTLSGADTSSVPAGFTRVWCVVQCPPGCDKAVPFVQTRGNNVGDLHYVTQAMFHPATDFAGVLGAHEVQPYFDGQTAPAGYNTSWGGDASLSPSTRRAHRSRRPESLVLKLGQSGMDFLKPLLQASGLRLVCDGERKWHLRDVDYIGTGMTTHEYAVNITEASEVLSRDAVEWYNMCVIKYVWRDRAGVEYTEVDAATAVLDPVTPVKMHYVELQDTPFPGIGRAMAYLNRAVMRGRKVTTSAVATWKERADQPLTVTLDGTPVQTGQIAAVEWSFDNDTVTVTGRTSDAPTLPAAPLALSI